MGEVAGFTGRHRDRLPLQRDQPPGIGGQVAQAQHPGPLGMGHHPRQGLLEILRQQGIEMVEVEFVAGGHAHQARGRAQAQRRRQGGGAAAAESLGGHLQQVLLTAGRTETPLIQAGGELLAPLAGLFWWGWLKRKLGGMTGDCLGAGIEVCEILLLGLLLLPAPF